MVCRKYGPESVRDPPPPSESTTLSGGHTCVSLCAAFVPYIAAPLIRSAQTA
jgi:hypothetical protein